VWSHPDLLPSAADLDDPLGFQENGGGTGAGTGSDTGAGTGSDTGPDTGSGLSDADFDAALTELLDREARGGDGPDDPSAR
ncbi:MAG: hypothetical protein WB441_05220, partial [Nocardioidaceae bacterium]